MYFFLFQMCRTNFYAKIYDAFNPAGSTENKQEAKEQNKREKNWNQVVMAWTRTNNDIEQSISQ